MLRFRNSRSRSPRVERRETPRYPVGETRAVLGWWLDSHYQTASCLILDLSHTGARIVAETAPADHNQAIWLCVAGDPPSAWIAARIVAAQNVPGQAVLVRLAFLEPCPYDVFKRVVPGFQFIPLPQNGDTSPGREQVWR